VIDPAMKIEVLAGKKQMVDPLVVTIVQGCGVDSTEAVDAGLRRHDGDQAPKNRFQRRLVLLSQPWSFWPPTVAPTNTDWPLRIQSEE
jgi:hypothetical protein